VAGQLGADNLMRRHTPAVGVAQALQFARLEP
jgi:hypothetical protein